MRFLKKNINLFIILYLLNSMALTALPNNSGSIYYRQHMQGPCEIIENDQDCEDDELRSCEETYDDDESFLADNAKQELSNYGLMTLSYHSPRGIGYDRGYYSLGFSHVIKTGKTGFFSAADWRFHVLSSGRLALNLGAGGRYIDGSLTHALGAFGYYDFRSTHLKNYHQVGVSLEWLTTCFDVRLNGYYPFGNPKSRTWHHIHKKSDPESYITNTYNYSYAHIELEIGTSFDIAKIIDFYIGAQSYYLKSREEVHNDTEAFGVRLRFVTTAQDRPSLELVGSYDPIFKVRAQFAFSIPLSYETSLISALTNTCSPELLRKIGALPMRDDIIILKSKHYRSLKERPTK